MLHATRIHRPALSLAAACLLASAVACDRGADASDPAPAAPPGWFLSGRDATSFRIAVDRHDRAGGAASGRLQSVGRAATGAATLMQSIPADPYRGKRVRLSAALRTDGVVRWAGLWMRVDRAGGRGAFDNMQDRPLRGTGAWTRRQVVLDVAADATAIQFGLLQDGPGASHIDDVALDVVDSAVPATDLDRRGRALRNAGFEAGRDGPDDWQPCGFGLEDMEIAVDRAQRRSGGASLRLQSRVPHPRGRAAVMQSIRAADHRGKRMRASAWLRGADADDAALLVQVMTGESGPGSEGISSGVCGAQGTFDWRRCDVVFDVPERADTIHITPYLEGRGTVWIDDVSLDEVGRDVPLTWVDRRPRAPENGSLERADGGAPAGWFISGGARGHYEAAIDRAVAHGGRSSARLSPSVASPGGYGTLMQLFRADDYRGRRMRMTAAVRGRGIEGRGDLWLRVQGVESPADGPGLGGGHDTLSGSFDWRAVSIVFDVPPAGDSIQWGVGLDGRGTIWIDDVGFEEVGRDVPLERGDALPSSGLTNGGLEDGLARPAGWFMSGGASGDYEVALDRDVRAAGTSSARLRSRVPAPHGYGTLMQSLRAGEHRGERLRARAQLRASGVAAGNFWLRVQAAYSPADGPGLAGGACPLAGDTGWTRCEIVFDVPGAGESIQLGFGLTGPGTLWLDDVSLEAVPLTVPLTGAALPPPGPVNLDFETAARRR
ncbi:MAG TPA: hypothetical protein VKB80_21280 [Kofleriaceae bacterium]|nr:hypothetical protein [Kofleriaceae bacterium]